MISGLPLVLSCHRGVCLLQEKIRTYTNFLKPPNSKITSISKSSKNKGVENRKRTLPDDKVGRHIPGLTPALAFSFFCNLTGSNCPSKPGIEQAQLVDYARLGWVQQNTTTTVSTRVSRLSQTRQVHDVQRWLEPEFELRS